MLENGFFLEQNESQIKNGYLINKCFLVQLRELYGITPSAISAFYQLFYSAGKRYWHVFCLMLEHEQCNFSVSLEDRHLFPSQSYNLCIRTICSKSCHCKTSFVSRSGRKSFCAWWCKTIFFKTHCIIFFFMGYLRSFTPWYSESKIQNFLFIDILQIFKKRNFA